MFSIREIVSLLVFISVIRGESVFVVNQKIDTYGTTLSSIGN